MNINEELLNKMTIEEKIGQMIIVRAYEFWDKTVSLIRQGKVAGVGQVFTKNHDRGIDVTIGNINYLKSISATPMFFYVDAEEGLSNNFTFGTTFPTMMSLGATFSKDLAYKMGNAIGTEAALIGFNIVCNPVLDINTNHDNPIIGTRAISDNTELVIELAGEYIKGMQEAGVIPLAKHYPGHGDTSEDSHIIMPVIKHDKALLMERELKPYKVLSQKGMWGVMTAHIVFPGLSSPEEIDMPATLSRNIITNILRLELGFDGIIVSDSLSMKGIKEIYGIEKSAVLAVKAGHDIILQDYASDPEIPLNAVVEAVRCGEIDINQINESVKRILKFKEQLGLMDNKPMNIEVARKEIGALQNIALSKEVCDKSVTVLEAHSIPIKLSGNEKILVIGTKAPEEGAGTEDFHSIIPGKSEYFYELCKKYSESAVFHPINENPSEEEIENVIAFGRNFDAIIFGSFIRVVSYKQDSGTISQSQAELINKLGKLDKEVVIVLFGNPYVIKKLDNPMNCLCTYSCDCEYSIESVLKIIFGEMEASGKLPVTVNEKYKFGYGLTTKRDD